MEWPLISVIVLNYNGREHLQDCFTSLLALDYAHCELLLVDNASTDDSVTWMREHFPSVRVVQHADNLGFAAGNNRGAEAAHGEYIAFLNNDTHVDAQWLRELIAPCVLDPAVVCTASKILDWDGQTIDFADAAMNFMGWGSQPGYGSRRLNTFSQRKELLFACGGGMLIKRQVFLDAGGFDADYFAYYEDADFGWRLWLMGHPIVFAPRAIIYHRHHGSWGAVADAKKWALFERNTLCTLIKNYDDTSLARVLPAALMLLIERAFLEINPDITLFGLGRAAALQGRAFGARYYFEQVRQLVSERDLPQLLRRSAAEAGRRWPRVRQSQRAPRLRPIRSAVGNQMDVPALALSRLVAARDVLHRFPSLLTKRRAIQAVRCHSDAHISRLFQLTFVSNFDDDQFIHAMQLAITRFGLVDAFADERPVLADGLIATSRETCLSLLRLMDVALTLSEAPEDHFRLGGPSAESLYRVSLRSIEILARAHALLWSLPAAPLADVLRFLARGCQQILSETIAT